MNTNTYALLIVFNNGTEKIIKKVSTYGFDTDAKCFYYHIENDCSDNYVPKEHVHYFGLLQNWYQA